MRSQENPARSLDLQLQIDRVCRDFEKQWQKGAVPDLEDYVTAVTGANIPLLLRELLLIEQHYREDEHGKKLTIEELRQLHPNLSEAIAGISGAGPESDISLTTTYRRRASDSVSLDELAPTQAPDSRKGSSRGLHIRCPHCSNPVELLGDASVDSIICQTCGSVFSLINDGEPTQQAPILKQIGRFQIVGRLGVGGFGTVWKARDPELERAVAIKIPRRGQLDNKEIESFIKEARTVAQLHHPNIVPVYEVGRDVDSVFIVSKLVRGISFSDWLADANPSFQQSTEILIHVADALEHAHQQGVIHRDLKPSNIMIDEAGQPIVMDFGLAKRDNLEIAMTLDGQILGTPAYMSPEQASGHSNWSDRRMDIYSFGVVLFRMLTGELPFRGNAQMQIHKRLTQDAPDPRTLNRFVPQDLATICLKCLERDPNGRYSSARQVAEELQRFSRGEPILARPISRVERTLRWAKRKPSLAAAAVLLFILAVGGTSAAILIEGLRQRQGELLIEKDNLISRMGQETTSLTKQLEQLEDQLDLWEGKANPWEIWPPTTIEPPQKKLLEGLLQGKNSLADDWRRSSDPVQQVYGHLALATTYDALSMHGLAFPEYSQARDKLREICANEQSSERHRIALADCCVRMARLSVEEDRELAAKYLREAEQALQQAGGSHLASSRVELLSVELAQAIMPGFKGAAESLNKAKQIGQSFPRIVPPDAQLFYQLACQLAGRTPHLALSGSKNEKNELESEAKTAEEKLLETAQ